MIRSLIALSALAAPLAAQGLPTLPVPAQNPITPQKTVLGKMLFWEEQLSSDDTMSCGTCHLPEFAGADPAFGRDPGPDGLPFTADDRLGSPGVHRHGLLLGFEPDPVFGFDRQVTPRTAPSAFTSQWAPEQFWDGRGADQFDDPQTGAMVLASGGSLESQAVGPVLSTSEMSAKGRTWTEVIQKLQNVKPMALATNLPPDIAAELAIGTPAPDYPELFRRAFGDPAITAARVGMAIATYERTVVPDDTPWDRFVAGNTSALTMSQQAGLQHMSVLLCTQCHPAPHFTDFSYRNLGTRPPTEDIGRQDVTGDPLDAGKFKVPSLRGVGLKPRFLHDGRFSTWTEIFDFYDGALPFFPDNIDVLYSAMSVPSDPPHIRAELQDFLVNGLTDARMAAGLPPFDRPTLRSERPGPVQYGAGNTGTGGFTPRLLAHQPAFPGAGDFRIGVVETLGGTVGALVIAAAPASYPGFPLPVHVDLAVHTPVPVILNGLGPGDGYGTAELPLPSVAALSGSSIYTQAVVFDGVATLGLALSDAVHIVID